MNYNELTQLTPVEISFQNPEFNSQLLSLYYDKNAIRRKDFQIEKIILNPEKKATTVLWGDGSHTVVKRSDGDEPADIWQVVSYALAEKVYGSNSAFKREVKGKVENVNEKKMKRLLKKEGIYEKLEKSEEE